MQLRVGGVVPTDPPIAADAAHRRVWVFRGPVLPHHRVADAVFLMDPVLLCDGERHLHFLARPGITAAGRGLDFIEAHILLDV